jgi:hypothetical protein
MVKRIAALVWLFCFLGCKNEPNSNNLSLINPTSSYSQFDLLAFVDTLEYIPLEENESTYLGAILKIIKTDNAYIIKCENRSAMFFFGLNGEYLKKVVATGEGPYEFSNLMDLAYDKKDNCLFLLDFENKKIITYDLKLDKIIAESGSLGQHAYSLEHFNSKLYLVSEFNKLGRMKIYSDSSYEFIGSGVFTKDEMFNVISTQENTKIVKDTLFLNASFTDTIYYSTGKKIEPYAILGDGENSITTVENKIEFAKRCFTSQFEGMTDEEKRILIPMGIFSVYNNIWFIHLIWPYQMIVWDRDNNIQRYLDYRDVSNSSLLFNYRLFNFHSMDEDGFAYSSIFLNEEFYYAANNVIKNNKHDTALINTLVKLIEKYPEGSEYENPIIVKFKFKDSLFKYNF